MAAISRNTGLKAATGRYIALLDQDDLWLPHKIAAQVKLMESRPDAVMTFCHYQLVDAAGTPTANQRPWYPLDDDPLMKFIRWNRVKSPSLVMLRREALDRIGPFDETIRGSSDWDMWMRCCQAGPVLSEARVMACYRQHEAQWSRNRVMIHQAEAQVLRKMAPWLTRQRPDLRRQHTKALSRALRRSAMARLAAGEGRRKAATGLLHAIRARPADLRNYAAAANLLRGVATDI
jgi:hypothetical protein